MNKRQKNLQQQVEEVRQEQRAIRKICGFMLVLLIVALLVELLK